jgi:CRISPR-associated protein Cmr1
MRNAPSNEPPPIEIDRSRQCEINREYEVITPLFGGGVDAGKNDPERLVRADQINGFLRFWWRACKGGASVEAMHKRESEIWGGKRAGAVSFEVKITNHGTDIMPDAPGIPPYAAFPLNTLNEKLPNDAKLKVRSKLQFKLCLRFPKSLNLCADIEAALWAWETFGGVGARTRRGFGALHPTKGAPLRATFRQWLEENLERHVTATSWPLDVPHLGPIGRYRYSSAATANAAWSWVIGELKAFRQARVGRKPTHWPEPDVIRRLTEDDKRHPPTHPVDACPRGQLGLPIIFHFKGPQEPPDTTLSGQQQFERLASPLILRPFQCEDGALALAAGLSGSEYIRNDLVLTSENGRSRATRSFVSPEEAAMPAPSAPQTAPNRAPLVVNGTTHTDVVEAFLARL